MRTSLRIASVVVMLCGSFLLSACSTLDVEFLETSEDYDAAALEALLETTTAPDLEERMVEEAPALRREALTELRSQSAAGAGAADIITKTFPDVAAVPFHVRTGRFEGTKAVLLIEAVSGKDGSLDARRLWAISREGEVLVSLMR